MKKLIYLTIITLTLENISIIGPKELSNILNKTIELEYATFGHLPSTFRLRGEIITDLENESEDACKQFKDDFIYNNPKFKSDFPIVIIKRGNCSFVTKARNAQISGAGMLIIVNNDNENIHNLIMSDDGTGNDINIPVGMISMNDGNKILDYVKNNPYKKITCEVEFDNFDEDIDLEFFFSSHEEKAYILIMNISDYFYQFGDSISFIPRYVTFQDPKYNKSNNDNFEFCFSKGKYCHFPKSGSIAKSYDVVLIEDLRQKCVYLKYGNQNLNYYFDYMNCFYKECYLNEEFNIDCSDICLEKVGIKSKSIDKCVADSFGVKKIITKNDYNNENSIFKEDYSIISKYGLKYFPTITLNSIPIEGIIKEDKVILALCDRVINKPEFCGFFLDRRKSIIGIGIWILVVFLVIVLILIIICLFFFCRNYISTRVHQSIFSQGIDIDGRINNAVANYFSLKESSKI